MLTISYYQYLQTVSKFKDLNFFIKAKE